MKDPTHGREMGGADGERRPRVRSVPDNALIDHLPGMAALLAPDGGVRHVNRELTHFFGQTETELADWSSNGTIHPDDLGHLTAIFGASIANGTPYDIEQRMRRHDGEYRWIGNRGVPFYNDQGRIIGWQVLLTDIHDRRLAESALGASEQSLKLIIDTIPVLAWSANADGTADFFNRHYLDYVGIVRENLRDWQWIDLVHPDDFDAIATTWERCRVEGSAGETEARLRRHDGVYRWFHFKTNPLHGADGEVAKWYGVNTDIEDRKGAEQALLDRERTLREAHDHLSQAQRLTRTGSFTTDVNADTHIWSDELYRILEHDRDEAPAFELFRQCVHPDDLPAFNAGFRSALVDRAEFDEVFRIVTPKGTTKYLHAIAHFISAVGERPMVVGSIQDITEQRLAEEMLRRSEYLLATAERISETGSYYWDLDRDKLVWSTQMYRIHEFDEDVEPAQLNAMAAVHPDDVAGVEEQVKRAFGGQASPEGGYRLVMPDGRIKYLRTAFQVVRHGDGRLESFGVAQDVTQRRLAEDARDELRSELAHVTRVMSLGELAASIAHEVNQPLSGIITNANACLRLLAADPPDIEGAIKTAQRSLRDGNRASEVTRRLRGLFRKQQYAPEPFDLNEAAREIFEICALDLQRRFITLQTDLDPALPPVLGDRIQLQQVILNLVLNAADALRNAEGRPRQISVSSGQYAPGVIRFAVRDNGTGIPPEDLDRIFDAFFTTKPNGMGIGLSVSKSILDHHGGKLWAGANDGAGLTFTFSVPCAAGGEP